MIQDYPKTIHIKIIYCEELKCYLAYYVDDRGFNIHPSSFHGEGEKPMEAVCNLTDNTCDAKMEGIK